MAFIRESVGYADPSKYPSPEVQNPWQKHMRWAAAMHQAQSSALVTTMMWRGDEFEAQATLDELKKTAIRGISTALHIDDLNRINFTGDRMSLLPKNPFSRRSQDWKKEFTQMCEQIRGMGITLNVSNPARTKWEESLPYVHRDHRKVSLIDADVKDDLPSKVAWFKDYNYGGNSYDRLCYGIEFRHPPTVEAIRRIASYSSFLDKDGHFINNRPAADVVIDIPGQPYKMVMDKGDIGPSSVMMDIALNIATLPGPAIFATQYPPSLRIAWAIQARAERGDPTLVITSSENDPNNMKGLSARRMAAVKWQRATQDNPNISTFYHYGSVHSKILSVMLLDSRGKPKGAVGIVGTNNFNEVGIFGGTPEFGIYMPEPSPLSNQLYFRHLDDLRAQEGYPMPYTGTDHERFFDPFTLKSSTGLKISSL